MMVVVISWDGESQTYSIKRVSVYWYIRNKTKMANSNFCLAVVAVRKWSLKRNARLPHVNQNRYIHECLELQLQLYAYQTHTFTYSWWLMQIYKYTCCEGWTPNQTIATNRSSECSKHSGVRMFETAMRPPNKISRKKQPQRIASQICKNRFCNPWNIGLIAELTKQRYILPSRELTYPPRKRHFWRWFVFSRGGICYFPGV